VITVGKIDKRIAANKVITSANKLAGFFDTKAGAMTEISTQPGTFSSTDIMRGLSV
jgi:hypothetical protein